MAGSHWDKACVRSVRVNRLSAVLSGADINPHAKLFARALKLRLHRIWFAPPELMVEEPRKWRKLIATAGLYGRAPNDAWGRLFEELQEIPILARRDLAEPRTAQLHADSEQKESNRLLGQLWRAGRWQATLKILANARTLRPTSAEAGAPLNWRRPSLQTQH